MRTPRQRSISADDASDVNRWLRLLAPLHRLLFWLALSLTPSVHAQSFPALTGRVVDQANLLSPAQEISLDTKLQALEKRSQRQLVVVTIADLQGYDIADYGFRLGDKWGIGDKERDDGALLIVAPKERKVRVEVGYGLEGVLTDALSGRIIRNAIVPRFKQGDFPGGIVAGTDEIIKVLVLPPEEAKKLAAQAEREQRDTGDNGEMIFVILFIAIFFLLPMLLRGRHGRAYRGGIAPVILWGPTVGNGRSSWGSGGGWSSGSGGGFSGGGGGFGGGGASGGW